MTQCWSYLKTLAFLIALALVGLIFIFGSIMAGAIFICILFGGFIYMLFVDTSKE